jgi:hypothetical protein
MQKVNIEVLAVQTEIEDKKAIDFYMNSTERILKNNIPDQEKLKNSYEELKKEFTQLDKQVKTDKVEYAKAQYYKRNKLANLYKNKILPAYVIGLKTGEE